MDFGNSGGSSQSSSGDEDHDSRAGTAEDSFSALINSNSYKRRALDQGGFQASNPANFDLVSNYLETISPPLNLDMAWSKTLTYDPPHHMINISPSSNPHPLFGSFSTASEPAPSVIPPARRNLKKRTRASRSAPTTVLTTDTNNFRAMVQEFTGIPAPPFPSPSSSSASPFSRLSTQRRDLYATATPSSLRSNPLDTSQTPSYLARPFPQKTPHPFLASSMVNLDHHSNFQLPTANAPNPFNSHLRVGGVVTDHFGHGNASSLVAGLPGLISSDQTTSNNNLAHWDMTPRVNVATNGKMNNFSSSTNPSDNLAGGGGGSRGEGMVESWICSSD